MLPLDRTAQPQLHWGEHITFPRYREWKLPDGDRTVYALPWQQEVQQVLVNFSARAVDAHPLVQVATAELLLRGSQGKTDQEVNYTLDLWGTSLSGVHARDRNIISMRSTKRFAHHSLTLLQELLHSPSFDERVLENWRAKELADFRIALQHPTTVARYALRQHLYPNHSYGYVPREEDFHRIQRQDLLHCWQHSYTQPRCTLFYAGDDDEAMRGLVGSAFGSTSWGDRAAAMPIGSGGWHYITPGGVLKNDADHDAQSTLLLGRLLPDIPHIDMVPLQVAVVLLGGYFGSRLMDNLREKHGYTYGVRAALALYEEANTITISAEIGNEYIVPAVEQVARELLHMQSYAPTAEKLHEVKAYMIGELLRRYDGQHKANVSMMNDQLFPQRGAGYRQRWLRRLMETTGEDVLQASRQWFTPGAFTLSLAGSAQAIKAVEWPAIMQ